MATGGPYLSKPTSRTLSGDTPLHRVAVLGDLSEIRRLIRSGADLGARGSDGYTPLMGSVTYGEEDAALVLVKAMTDRDLSVVDSYGYTVLHLMALWARPWSQVIQNIVNTCPTVLLQRDVYGDRPSDTARSKLPRTKVVYDMLKTMTQQLQQKQFTKGIAGNEEQPCNITITVVGHHGVGKSCFVRQLKQESIPEGGPGSTDTADFYVNFLGYNPDTGYRETMDEDGEIETGRQRLKRIIDRYRKDANTAIQTSEDKPAPRHDKEGSTSTSDLPTESTNAPTVDARLSSARKGTGTKQKLKKFLSKFPFRRKVKEIPQPQPQQPQPQRQQPQPQQSQQITNEQRHVIEQVMVTEKEDKPDEEVKGYVTIYDFGGEKVFYNSHHCFMSSNMVFVLVFDVAMCLDPSRAKDGYERIEFWLKNIVTYAIDRKAHGKGTPPVILVGSHLDIVSKNKEEQVRMFDSVLEKLCEKPELLEIIESHVQEMIPIADLNDSTKNQDSYELVWNKIISIAPLQSHWMKPVPARWVALEYELVRLKNEGKIILTYADLLEINRKSAVPLTEDNVMEFLMKLRFSGSFLCFDIHSKSPFIVLQPQWIIHAFKAIITESKFTSNLSAKQRLLWSQYKKSGVLSYDFIRQLWGRPLKGYRLLEEEERLFIIMETLGLLTKPISVDTEVDYFIVPSILQPADPEIIKPVLADPDTVTTVTLCVKFDNPFIPQAIWDKMIAACIHRFQRLTEPGNEGLTFIRRGFACLSVDCMWNMIINCSDNAMKVTMFKTSSDHSVPTGTGINLLNILEYLLRRILELNHQSHLEYQFYLHNDFRFTADERMVKVEDLRQNAPLRCNGLNGPVDIERNNLYIWFTNPCEKENRTPNRYGDKKKELPDRKLSFKEIGRVSRYIGGTYQTFFAELNCPVEVVEQEMEEHRHLTFRSRMAKIFIHLLKMKADVGFLPVADAMTRHGMDSSKLKEILDSNRNTMFIDAALSQRLLKTKLSVNDVPVIADCIDVKSYFNLFLELGLPPKTVDEFDDHYRNKKTLEKITALLKACIKETKPRPTVNTLLLAMQECDMDTESVINALRSS